MYPGTDGRSLVQGERIEFRDFGSFDLHNRTPRIARNPETGVAINLRAKVVIHFRPGKDMRDRVMRRVTNAASRHESLTNLAARYGDQKLGV